MSGTGKINDFVPFGTSLMKEVSYPLDILPQNKLMGEIESLKLKLKMWHIAREQAVTLIKDGRFVEALQELENETLA